MTGTPGQNGAAGPGLAPAPERARAAEPDTAPERAGVPERGVAPQAPQRGFAADAELHRRDAPRHCPRCGASLAGGAGISVEFWQGDDRVFHTWCARCRWTGDIIPVADMIGHEPEH